MSYTEEFCRWKGVEMREGEASIDHIHISKNTAKIAEYIKNQIKEDQLIDRLPLDLNDSLMDK